MQSIRTCEWDKWPNKKLVLSSNPKSSLTLYALFIYCPVLESTRMSSPTFTKEGTVTTAQVSRVASFVPPTKYSNNTILVTGMPSLYVNCLVSFEHELGAILVCKLLGFL